MKKNFLFNLKVIRINVEMKQEMLSSWCHRIMKDIKNTTYEQSGMGEVEGRLFFIKFLFFIGYKVFVMWDE